MILTILHYPDPKLREKAQPVREITPEIQRLADDMAETMYAAPGVGLAATQVGVPLRVFVVDIAREDEPSRLVTFINPEIVEREGEQTWEEGCLSFPDVSEDVKRAVRVRVRAQDRTGAPFELEAEGFMAVAIQHEYDHLDGVLMIDHMGALRKLMVHRKLEKRLARDARP
ncbi:MAG: peptide deformylase [Polyangiaceae bacterium]|nr:peptide deformylase [Polyangiaceae bacterium]